MYTTAIRKRTRIGLILLATLSLALPLLSAETPAPETLKAFDSYVKAAEARNNEELAARTNFLWLDVLPQPERDRTYGRLKHQQTVIRHSASCLSRDCSDIPGGMIHDWTGISFVPGVTLAQALAALQDYDRDAEYYRPTVLRAKLLSREGNSFRVFLRLKETHVSYRCLGYRIRNSIPHTGQHPRRIRFPQHANHRNRKPRLLARACHVAER
jgi:hypothetical protein